MAYRKKTSKILENAGLRLAGLKSIGADLDLGNGITVKAYSKKIDDAADALEQYNTALSVADEKSNQFETNELDLSDFHERILMAVGVKYGKNSNEYEKAGGTKKSERKRSVKSDDKTVK
ncbi:MAG: hypothetical protein H7Z37_17670 [Pyrinomonadaceae bacterium]|nr:hypothetical protein [Pyrinomonadaceae bacterium]